MRRFALGLVLVVSLPLAGCYGRGGVYVRGPNPFGVIATAVAVASVVNAVATAPPVAMNVEYYDAGYNPGNVWVNGRYTYVNNNWVWQAGYWQPERDGAYWIQGAWTPRGNQYVWTDGYWAQPRAGYTYIDGYWDDRGNGYVWAPGRWEVERPGQVYVGGSWSTNGGRRTWSRGSWQRDDGRAEWGRYRTRGRATGRTGPAIRDHRR
jgi:hypothetical protein